MNGDSGSDKVATVESITDSPTPTAVPVVATTEAPAATATADTTSTAASSAATTVAPTATGTSRTSAKPLICGLCKKKMPQKGKALPHCGHRFHFKCLKQYVSLYNNCPSCGITMTPVRFEDFKNRVKNRYMLKFGKRLNKCNQFRRKQLYQAIVKAYESTHFHQTLARVITAKMLVDSAPNALEMKDQKYLRTALIVNRRYLELRNKFIAEEPHFKCVDESF